MPRITEVLPSGVIEKLVAPDGYPDPASMLVDLDSVPGSRLQVLIRARAVVQRAASEHGAALSILRARERYIMDEALSQLTRIEGA